MRKYKYGSTSVHFFEIRGRVAGSSKRSETKVSSSTDGEYVTNVRSSTTTKAEFWLVKDDGTEVPVQLSGRGGNIPVRNGHEVSAIAANLNDGSNFCPYVALVNHTARRADRARSKENIRDHIDLTTNPKYAWISFAASLILTFVSVGMWDEASTVGDEWSIVAAGVFAGICGVALAGSVLYLPFNIVRHLRASSKFYDDIQWIADQVLQGNTDALKGPTKEYRGKSRSVSLIKTATGSPLIIAFAIGYGLPIYDILSYAMSGPFFSQVSNYFSIVPIHLIILDPGWALLFILAWVLITGLVYGYRRC